MAALKHVKLKAIIIVKNQEDNVISVTLGVKNVLVQLIIVVQRVV